MLLYKILFILFYKAKAPILSKNIIKKEYVKFLLLFNKRYLNFRIFNCRNVNHFNLSKKAKRRLPFRRRKFRKLLKKYIKLMYLKIKILYKIYPNKYFYFYIKFKKRVAIRKLKYKKYKKRRCRFAKKLNWLYFILFKKIKIKKFKFVSLFNSSHSHINEKLKKLRRK